MPKISIIVPVYNAEKYLHRCIDSILSQTFSDFELILIDDGSTDMCSTICDKYVREDNRIIIIHKRNGGASSARNTGMKIVRGCYLGFIDSDDAIKSEMYDVLYDYAKKENDDIVMCDMINISPDGANTIDTMRNLPTSTILFKEMFYPKLLEEYAGSACRCLYKYNEQIFERIAFSVGIRFAEDKIFNFQVFGSVGKIRYLKRAYYLRYVRLDSSGHRFYYDFYSAMRQSYNYTKSVISKFWPKEFLLICEDGIIAGSKESIYNALREESKFSLLGKLFQIKQICNDEDLRNAIVATKDNSYLSKLIMSKKVIRILWNYDSGVEKIRKIKMKVLQSLCCILSNKQK